MKNKNVLLYVLISFSMLACNEAFSSKKQCIKEQVSNPKFNKEFVRVIDGFIDSVEANWTIKPLLGIENFYYTVKFFEIQDSVFFTMRISYSFPDYEYFNSTFYKNDKSCMYYFKLNNRNVIIIDYPESNGHDLFKKNAENNNLAIVKLKNNEVIINEKSDSIRPSNPDMFRKTFKVRKTIKGVELNKLDSVMLVPPYANERNNYIQIIEDEL